MTMNYTADFPSVRDQVSPEEWAARVELAACYRLMDRYGMTDLIYNHITAKVPGTEDFLVNLYGLLYKEITASSLVKIDLDGDEVRPDAGYAVMAGAPHNAQWEMAKEWNALASAFLDSVMASASTR